MPMVILRKTKLQFKFKIFTPDPLNRLWHKKFQPMQTGNTNTSLLRLWPYVTRQMTRNFNLRPCTGKLTWILGFLGMVSLPEMPKPKLKYPCCRLQCLILSPIMRSMFNKFWNTIINPKQTHSKSVEYPVWSTITKQENNISSQLRKIKEHLFHHLGSMGFDDHCEQLIPRYLSD